MTGRPLRTATNNGASDLVDAIMSLPKDERLGAAIDAIHMVLGTDSHAVIEISQHFGMSKTMARVLEKLLQRGGSYVTRQNLHSAVWGVDSDILLESVNVTMVGVRKAVHKKTGIRKELIGTVWGIGYCATPLLVDYAIKHLSGEADTIQVQAKNNTISEDKKAALVNKSAPWSTEDNATMALMINDGSTWASVAYQLGRTERACIDRHNAMCRKVTP